MNYMNCYSIEELTERLNLVKEIIKAVTESEMSQEEIAKKFNLSDRSIVSRILKLNGVKPDIHRLSNNRTIKSCGVKDINELRLLKTRKFVLYDGTLEKRYVKYCKDNNIDILQKEISDLGEIYYDICNYIKTTVGNGPFNYEYIVHQYGWKIDWNITKRLAIYMCKSMNITVCRDMNKYLLILDCAKQYISGKNATTIAKSLNIDPKVLCNDFVRYYGKNWKKLLRSKT